MVYRVFICLFVVLFHLGIFCSASQARDSEMRSLGDGIYWRPASSGGVYIYNTNDFVVTGVKIRITSKSPYSGEYDTVERTIGTMLSNIDKYTDSPKEAVEVVLLDYHLPPSRKRLGSIVKDAPMGRQSWDASIAHDSEMRSLGDGIYWRPASSGGVYIYNTNDFVVTGVKIRITSKSPYSGEYDTVERTIGTMLSNIDKYTDSPKEAVEVVLLDYHLPPSRQKKH